MYLTACCILRVLLYGRGILPACCMAMHVLALWYDRDVPTVLPDQMSR